MPDSKPDKCKVNQIYDYLCKFLFIFMTIFFMALMLFIIFDTNGFTNLVVILPVPLVIKLLYLLLTLYLTIVLTVSGTLVLNVSMFYGYYLILFVTTELRVGQTNYKTSHDLRQRPEHLFQTYRAFQILHRNFLNLFGQYVLVANVLFMISLIYLFFVLIRYWSQISVYARAPMLLGTFLCLAVWTSIIILSIMLETKGKKVLHSWNGSYCAGNNEKKIMQKFKKSCKPLIVCHGTQFVIRKNSILVFYRGVTKGTFRALLMTK